MAMDENMIYPTVILIILFIIIPITVGTIQGLTTHFTDDKKD